VSVFRRAFQGPCDSHHRASTSTAPPFVRWGGASLGDDRY